MRAGRLPSLSSPVSDELDRLRNVIPARPFSAASDGKANTGIHSIYAGTDKDGSARTRPPRCAPVHPHFISQRQTGQRTLLIRMACLTAYGEQTSPPPSNCASHNTSGASYRDRTAPGDARSKTEYTYEKVVNATVASGLNADMETANLDSHGHIRIHALSDPAPTYGPADQCLRSSDAYAMSKDLD